MSCITWDDETMSVNVVSLDAQHHHLIRLISEYEAALSAGKSQETLREILFRLIEYTYAHFSFEERLLCYSCFPEAQKHCCEHACLKEKIDELLSDWDSGKQRSEIEILTFLVKWLKGHVLKMDKKYSSHLAVNGIF